MDSIPISFNYQGRYYKSSEININTKQIWFILHGYGQLAQYFIKKFRSLESENICVIAPEGLSHFYIENLESNGRKNNRVGASWMTRENRLTDIDNYINYLQQIYNKEIKDHSIPITVLGFSQGSATASRWLLSGKVNFKKLILWAGIFPPDMDFENGKQILKGKEITLVYGTKDPFLNDERFSEMEALSKKLDTHVHAITFDGAHEIDEPTLLKLI
jgi:predicted esterase